MFLKSLLLLGPGEAETGVCGPTHDVTLTFKDGGMNRQRGATSFIFLAAQAFSWGRPRRAKFTVPLKISAQNDHLILDPYSFRQIFLELFV